MAIASATMADTMLEAIVLTCFLATIVTRPACIALASEIRHANAIAVAIVGASSLIAIRPKPAIETLALALKAVPPMVAIPWATGELTHSPCIAGVAVASPIEAIPTVVAWRFGSCQIIPHDLHLATALLQRAVKAGPTRLTHAMHLWVAITMPCTCIWAAA